MAGVLWEVHPPDLVDTPIDPAPRPVDTCEAMTPRSLLDLVPFTPEPGRKASHGLHGNDDLFAPDPFDIAGVTEARWVCTRPSLFVK